MATVTRSRSSAPSCSRRSKLSGAQAPLPSLRKFPKFSWWVDDRKETAFDGTSYHAPMRLIDDLKSEDRIASEKRRYLPVQFEPQECAKRFIILCAAWAPTGRPISQDSGTKEGKRAWKEYFEACDNMPLPATYADVPPAGAAIGEWHTEPMRTRADAIAFAVRLNQKLVEQRGRKILGYCSDDWHIVVEVGKPRTQWHDFSMDHGFGVLSASHDFPIRITMPTEEERRANIIDWSKHPAAKGGAA